MLWIDERGVFSIQKLRLILFDADGTLWECATDDWLSKKDSEFNLLSKDTVLRKVNGARYRLQLGTRDTLQHMKNAGVLLGIVSDNKKKDVMRLLKLFDIYRYFDKRCFEIKLFEGQCPKSELVEKIIKRLKKKGINIKPHEVLVIDDKDYRSGFKRMGINFLRFGKDIKQLSQLTQYK